MCVYRAHVTKCFTWGRKLKPAGQQEKIYVVPIIMTVIISVPFIILSNQMYYLYFMGHGICCWVYVSNENDYAIELKQIILASSQAPHNSPKIKEEMVNGLYLYSTLLVFLTTQSDFTPHVKFTHSHTVDWRSWEWIHWSTDWWMTCSTSWSTAAHRCYNSPTNADLDLHHITL